MEALNALFLLWWQQGRIADHFEYEFRDGAAPPRISIYVNGVPQ